MTDSNDEMNEEWNDEDTERLMEGMNTTFELVVNGRSGELKTPMSEELDFTGEKAEAMGSARHIADLLQEEGYDATTEYVCETTPINPEDERHTMRIEVTEE